MNFRTTIILDERIVVICFSEKIYSMIGYINNSFDATFYFVPTILAIIHHFSNDWERQSPSNSLFDDS